MPEVCRSPTQSNHLTLTHSLSQQRRRFTATPLIIFPAVHPVLHFQKRPAQTSRHESHETIAESDEHPHCDHHYHPPILPGLLVQSSFRIVKFDLEYIRRRRVEVFSDRDQLHTRSEHLRAKSDTRRTRPTQRTVADHNTQQCLWEALQQSGYRTTKQEPYCDLEQSQDLD
jgi:hypothetical protein